MVFTSSRALIVLLMLLITVVPVQAQEMTDASSEAKKAQAKAEEVEAASDLRESIHENLETLSEDAEIAEDLKKDAVDEQQPVDSAETSATQADEPGEPPAEDKSILGFFKSIPVYLQSVPDRVPFIRDRGLIFFGRTEIDYAHYSSGVTKSDSGFMVRILRACLA